VHTGDEEISMEMMAGLLSAVVTVPMGTGQDQRERQGRRWHINLVMDKDEAITDAPMHPFAAHVHLLHQGT
jgi:hypothetical protein